MYFLMPNNQVLIMEKLILNDFLGAKVIEEKSRFFAGGATEQPRNAEKTYIQGGSTWSGSYAGHTANDYAMDGGEWEMCTVLDERL
jgi:hypothetical protein